MLSEVLLPPTSCHPLVFRRVDPTDQFLCLCTDVPLMQGLMRVGVEVSVSNMLIFCRYIVSGYHLMSRFAL